MTVSSWKRRLAVALVGAATLGVTAPVVAAPAGPATPTAPAVPARPAVPTAPAADPVAPTDPRPSAQLHWYGEGSSATGAALNNSECDVNGDDHADAVVGAWFWDKGALANVGAAYVVLGKPALAGGSLATPSSVGAIRIDGPSTANAFIGFAVGCLGDVDGDGIDDIGISYYVDNKVYVVRGATDFSAVNLTSLGDRGFVITGGATQTGNLGYSLAQVGDLNADGRADFAVAEVAADTLGRTNNGRVWVIAGQDDIADIDLSAPAAGQVLLTIDGAIAEERLGQMANVGDVNGDGVDDVLLGSYTSTPWGSSVAVPGAAYVVWGGNATPVDTADLNGRGFQIRGPKRQRDRLGISVSGLGDVNGDGKADLLIGADGVANAVTGPRSGSAAVVFGSASEATVYTDPLAANGAHVYTCTTEATAGDCTTPADVTARGYWIEGAAASDSFGYALAGIGDVNGDAVPDLAVGAYGHDPINPTTSAAMSGAGAVYVIYGKATTSPISVATMAETQGYRVDGRDAGDRFGRQVALVGDMDGNGVNDFAGGGDFAKRPLAPGTPLAQAGEVTVVLLGELATTTAVTVAPATAAAGDPLTLTATVDVTVDAKVDGGTVAFTLGGVDVPGCEAVAVDAATGVATCDTTASAFGDVEAGATYSGTAWRAGSTGTSTPVVVSDETTTSLTGPASVQEGVARTYTASVDATTSQTPAVGGTVAFSVGGTPVAGCEAVPVVDGEAPCETSFPAEGSVTLSASYSGTPLLGASGPATLAVTVVADPVPDGATHYQKLTPCRLVDTRQTSTSVNGTITVPATGRCGVPAEATAVSISMTAVGTSNPGYLTAWPSGLPRPVASNVNYAKGQTRGNGAIVALGDDGAIDLFTYVKARGITVDVTGAFVPTDQAEAGGRFTAVGPVRAFDSRQTGGFLANHGTRTIALPAGVPADATAVTATVTITQTTNPSYVIAWPAGTARPTTSVLNADAKGQTRAAGAVIPVSPSGLTVEVEHKAHVVVDVTGYFTSDAAVPGYDGLFVPLAPERLLDTRSTATIPASGSVDVEVPAEAGAVALNATILPAGAEGYLTLFPTGATRPSTSTVNASGATDIAAASAVVGVGDDSSITVRSLRPANAVVDLAGWFTKRTDVVDSFAFANRKWVPTAHDTCPASLHETFTAIGPDRRRYPTWHAPTAVDPATGQTCTFGHEHGDDPAGSDIYEWAMDRLEPGSSKPGIPFGLASDALNDSVLAGSASVTRHEDHVGHKVFFANDVRLVAESPRGFVRFPQGSGSTGTIVECDYLTKVHQGSHSADATSNNVHEVFYAMRCNDGTELAVTLHSRMGNPNEYHRSCAPDTAVATAGSNLPAGDGGGRLIPDRGCIDQFVLVPQGTSAHTDIWSIYEVWKTLNEITKPDGTILASNDPWYAVRNPSRYGWAGHGANGTHGIGHTVDASWETDPADDGKVNANPWLAAALGPVLDPQDPASPFDGAERDFYLADTTVANAGGPTIWYTDAYGANASTTPFPGSIRQYIGSTDNTWYPTLERRVLGLDVDYGGNGVHAPN